MLKHWTKSTAVKVNKNEGMGLDPIPLKSEGTAMIEMNFTESFIKQQVKCLDILSELIAYDKQHGDPPEKQE